MGHWGTDGKEGQPKWRLLFCFRNRPRLHEKNGPCHLSKRTTSPTRNHLRPRKDNPTLRTYEDYSSSGPLVHHDSEIKPSLNSASSKVKVAYTYTELGDFIDRSKQHEQVCVDDYHDSDAASTYYVDVKKDGEQSIVSGITLPTDLQTRTERLGAQQRRNSVTPATTGSLRITPPPSSLPRNSAESVSLRSLYYDYGDDDKTTGSGSTRRTSYSAQALAAKQRQTNGSLCWL